MVVVKEGKIAGKFYSLIRPIPNYYSRRNTQVHGLTAASTQSAPEFPEVWEKVSRLIGGLPLVAHNSPFDESCLKAAFKAYGMPYPNYTFHCTYRAAKVAFCKSIPNHRLHTVAQYCGYCLENHHHALADAEACAHIAIRLISF